MPAPATAQRYSGLSIALHWLMLLLIVGVYTCTELREFYDKGAPMRDSLKSWHYTLGLTVFALVWIRIVARLMGPTPAIVPEPPAVQALLTRILHIALYALMVLMPIGGMLILSGEAKAIPFWGLELPPLIGPDKDLAHTVEEIHETFGKIGYALIALHALGAIYHHRFVKDNTLVRMMPGGRSQA
jgi:cytochrome b561